VVSCGTCDVDCREVLGTNRVNLACSAPVRGQPGTCTGDCADGYYDIDGVASNGCEYPCSHNPDGTVTRDLGGVLCGADDDCDGEVDEDIDFCADANNCGVCGRSCSVANGTGQCVSNAAAGEACAEANTECAIDTCDPGWVDRDGAYSNGCEELCTITGPEVCDGEDNDCDGLIDDADPDLQTNEATLGTQCFGGTEGLCADAAHAGINKCFGGAMVCCDVESGQGACNATTGPQVVRPDEQKEVCDSIDNDCDGVVDDSPTDTGGSCGSSVGSCQAGTWTCNAGTRECTGQVLGSDETCNGIDNNCDGVIDGTITAAIPVPCVDDNGCTAPELCMARGGTGDKVCAAVPADVGDPCDVPPAAPAGATSPCQAGAWACIGGARICAGSVKATTTVDTCGEDSNCDGTLDSQPQLDSDVRNCGSCGNDCNAAAPGGNAIFACVNSQCVVQDCLPGFIDCDGDPNTCERACTPIGTSEQACNGQDDDCNCQIDEGLTPPSTSQACGVSASATDAGCTTGVTVACSDGAWRCTFTDSSYCTGAFPDYCVSQADVCDGLDNNCNGAVDESFKPPVLTQGYLGQSCASDDGIPAPGHGACRGTGTYVCDGPSATRCTAVKNDAAASAELCDGVDNDCDSLIDEPFTNKGTNATFFVKPAVTKIAANLWVYQYEASRPGATATDPGSGNGYQSTAPAGVPIEATQSCSASGVMPWFNVSPDEADQTCQARGGRLCTIADWQTACHANQACTYGYAPRANCDSPGNYNTGNPSCNIGPFDTDGNPLNGKQSAVLPTADPSLNNCFADWSGLQGNTTARGSIFDMMGNLREITSNGATYTLMGGAFTSAAESGATCDFSFFNVNDTFKLYDAGFRCCFDADPTQ